MISIDDIVKKEFSRSFLGYDMREVDLFLDAIIEQLEADERERVPADRQRDGQRQQPLVRAEIAPQPAQQVALVRFGRRPRRLRLPRPFHAVPFQTAWPICIS